MFQVEEIQKEFKCNDLIVFMEEEFTFRNGKTVKRLNQLRVYKIIKTDKNIYFNGVYISGLGKEVYLDEFEFNSKKIGEYLGLNQKNISEIDKVFSLLCAQLMI